MKKGFTLIELLAVIVILAIISVIAVPIVLNIIDEAKQSSTLRSADFYLDAVEMSIAGATLKNQSIKDGTYNTKDGNICLNEECTEILEVEVNGEIPEVGYITISGGKIVSTQLITNNNMIVKNDKGELIYPTLANSILKGYGGIDSIKQVDFKTNPNVNGIYVTLDDLGMSYYYRGNINNNYVKFGKWDDNATEIRGYYSSTSTSYKIYDTLEKCSSSSWYNYNCSEVQKEEAGKDIYWKIVRINGDGTIRLTYAGTELTELSGGYIESIGKTQFNLIEGVDSLKYTYKYGTNEVDSTAKTFVDNWYKNNLLDNYSKYISDGIFCNNYEEMDLSEFQSLGRNDIETNNYLSKPYSTARRISNQTPTMKCSNEESKYSLNETIGNGKLTYPIALINAEEVYFIDILYDFSSEKYDHFLTMTPGAVDNYLTDYSDLQYNVYRVWPFWEGILNLYPDGNSIGESTHIPEDVSPVINLKADVKFKGDGSRKTPYEIITE